MKVFEKPFCSYHKEMSKTKEKKVKGCWFMCCYDVIDPLLKDHKSYVFSKKEKAWNMKLWKKRKKCV